MLPFTKIVPKRCDVHVKLAYMTEKKPPPHRRA
jgi:hypothetical protein